MIKTISALAILTSASTSMAMIMPGTGTTPPPVLKTACLSVYDVKADGSALVDSCDDSGNNVELKRTILENGCAADQVAIQTYAPLMIDACRPAGIVQL